MKIALTLLALFLLAPGCGSSDSVPPPECSGTSCACPAGEACGLQGSDCEQASCSLDCSADNECTGTCGASCSVDCGGGSTCELTVGESSSVTCSDGATCHITCSGSCSVSCSDDSTCELTCPGDSAPTPIVEGGSCE